MKHSVSEAARIVGITRKTFYKHIEKKGISVEKDDNDMPRVDASELIRVYGDKCRFEEQKPQPYTEQGAAVNPKVTTPDTAIEIAVLKEKVANLEQQRDQYQKLYDQERQDRQAGMRLLTDQREKQDKWETSFAELRNQVLQQEHVAARELSTFKEETARKLRLYQRALQAEREKSVWEKLFGREKKRKGQGGEYKSFLF